MRKICAFVASTALAACSTTGEAPDLSRAPQPQAAAIVSVVSAADARRAIRTNGKPSPREQLLGSCASPPALTAQGTFNFDGAVIAPLVMVFFNLAVGAIDRYLKAREAQHIKDLSYSFTGNSARSTFPLAPTDDFSCIDIKDGDASEYVLRMRALKSSDEHAKPLPSTAFVIEPVGAWVGSSGITVTKDRSGIVNADLAMVITSVTTSDGTMPNTSTYPSFNMRFEELQEGTKDAKLVTAGDPHRSVVLPLPRDPNSATSIVVSVTESDKNLDKVKERIALQQQTRAALFDALGEILKGQLGG